MFELMSHHIRTDQHAAAEPHRSRPGSNDRPDPRVACSTPRLRQVAAAVGHDRVVADVLVHRLAEVLEHELHAVARAAEDDGRDPCADQVRGEADSSLERAAADAELVAAE